MTGQPNPGSSMESRARRGLVNGNGFADARGKVNGHYKTGGLVNGLGRVNGTGLTNGLGHVNGVGKTNGLSRTPGRVNGVGHINGTGRTNGLIKNGFVNGHGLVNGTRKPLHSNVFGIVTQKDLRLGISLAVLFILLLPSFFLIVSPPQAPAPRISIDGQFADWTKIPGYHDVIGGVTPNIAITDYALLQEEETVFAYLKVEGQLFMETRAYDGFYAFIDADGHQTTGYWPEEIGAEYAVFITGGDGRIANSDLMRFIPASDPLNWTAWSIAASVPSAFLGNSLEFAVGLRGLNLSQNFALRFAANNFDGNSSLASLRIGRTYGAMMVEQSPRTELTPLTPARNKMLHLSMHAFGKRVEITDFPASAHWETYPAGLSNNLSLPNQLFIDPGDTIDLDVDLDLTGLRRGDPVWLNLTRLDANVPVTLHGDGGVAYVEQLPQYKRVDGWFGDWQSGTQSDTAPHLANSNVDIDSYASNITRIGASGSALFYVDFAGKAMAGSIAPSAVKWVAPSQPSPPSPAQTPRRVAGQDRLIISIDTNSNDTAGCQAPGMFADLRIEIRGHARKVDSRTVYTCFNQAWTLTATKPSAMVSDSKIEASVDLSVLGTLDQPKFLIETTDWSGIGDMPPLEGLGTRSAGGTRGAEAPRLMGGSSGTNVTESMPLSTSPVIDGKCDDPVYSEAGQEQNISFKFFVGNTSLRVFVCIIFYDSSNDTSDNASIMFDTKHDGLNGQEPQDDDRLFIVFANNNSISRRRGDGTGWTSCDFFCGGGDDANATFFLLNQNYEFSINVSNVWNGTITAGFAILMHNATGPTNYSWGSWNVQADLPFTWGHLNIPEFPAIIMPILIVVALTIVRRKRRHA